MDVELNNQLVFDGILQRKFSMKMDIVTWKDVIFNNSSIGIMLNH